MARAAFLAMRTDLIARGLLSAEHSGEHRLTEAGHAHVGALIEHLQDEEAPCDPTKARVRWSRRRGRSARA